MSEYFCIVTETGLTKLAAAQAAGETVALTHFALGDSNGTYYEPSESATALANERWRGAVNRVYVSPASAKTYVVETIVPVSAGGFFIREAGVFDADGDLIVIAKYPLTEKPEPLSGGAKELVARMFLRVSNAGTITITVDSSTITLTQSALDATDWKNSCRAATTANVSLAGGAPAVVDAVTLVAGNRLLVKSQALPAENGVYQVQTLGTGLNGTWVRATDADSVLDLTACLTVAVEDGAANGDSIWMLTTNGPITLGTTPLSFACVYGPGDKSEQHAALYSGHGGQTPLTISGSTGNTIDATGHRHAVPDLDLKSPIASPAFTGVPTAPTAPVDTNTQQLATTGFVTGQASAIAPLMDGVAAVGTSKRYARGDHRHPTDTTLASLVAMHALLGQGGPGVADYIKIPYRDKTTDEEKYLIVQWARSANLGDLSDDGPTVNISFPIPFPTAVRVVIPYFITPASSQLSGATAWWDAYRTTLSSAAIRVRELVAWVQTNHVLGIVAIGF